MGNVRGAVGVGPFHFSNLHLILGNLVAVKLVSIPLVAIWSVRVKGRELGRIQENILFTGKKILTHYILHGPSSSFVFKLLISKLPVFAETRSIRQTVMVVLKGTINISSLLFICACLVMEVSEIDLPFPQVGPCLRVRHFKCCVLSSLFFTAQSCVIFSLK